MEKIKLDEIILNNSEKDLKDNYTYDSFKQCIKEGIRQALKLAADNAKVCQPDGEVLQVYDYFDDPQGWVTVHKQSIIEIINQVE